MIAGDLKMCQFEDLKMNTNSLLLTTIDPKHIKKLLMRQMLLLLILTLSLLSCENKTNNYKIDTEANRFHTNSNDEEMNAAIETAKKSFDDFDKAYKSHKYDTSNFSIKVKFPSASGFEHIWTKNLIRQDTCFLGNIDEPPFDSTIHVNVGDIIKITKENLSDWMYVDSGVLIGGYTIRVPRNHMSPEKRKKFDASLNLIIRD